MHAYVALELKMKTNLYTQGRVSTVPRRNEQEKPTSQKPKRSAKAGKRAWLVPVGLILLSAIPLVSGAFRLTQLFGGATITPENVRFFVSPLPVVVHIISVSLYAVLGAFQFVPRLRQRRNRWHSMVGRMLIPCGLAVALSGLWMTLFYPWPAGDGILLYGLRLLFGSAMLLAILLGTDAIRRRDFVRHGNWMLRGYAIGLGAGTQVFTLMIGELIAGPPSVLSRAILMGAAWVINLTVAEWIIRTRRPSNAVHTHTGHARQRSSDISYLY